MRKRPIVYAVIRQICLLVRVIFDPDVRGLEVVSLIMEAREPKSLSYLEEKMEQCRRRLLVALDAAGGNQQDPTVQRISAEFDEAMNDYMRRMRRFGRN